VCAILASTADTAQLVQRTPCFTMASEESKTAGEGKPLKVVLTGAAGNIAYALSFMISQGSMFGARKVGDVRKMVASAEPVGAFNRWNCR